MVPPDSIFGSINTWVGVYLALAAALAASGHFLYHRVIKLILLGRRDLRFDQPLKRLFNFLLITPGQKKVLQRFSLKDKSGLGHVIIFYGFLSFLLSYVIFIFGDSVWRDFSKTLLTETGAQVYAMYLDIMAGAILFALAWAFLRRWVAKPHRLSFDLTRAKDAVIIVALIATLMVSTLLTEAFYVAKGGVGPESKVIIGGAIGDWFVDLGIGFHTANTFHGLFWWLHLLTILGFGIYIQFSKHMHMMAAPVNSFFKSLKPSSVMDPIDLEKAEHFGAGRVQDLTWKQLLDGYACAVCGRCTASCPAHLTGKVLSPMHIVENTKDYLLEFGPVVARGQEPPADKPLIGHAVSEEAIWDCVTCGACMEECPVQVEHVPTIMDMRRNLVLEQSKLPPTAMDALMSMEQRGHPWRGSQFSRIDWAKGLDVKTIAEKPSAEVLFWVGCTAALEQKSQRIARAMARVLLRAGIDFAILGDEERCTGDPARRMGNEYLFQTLAAQNVAAFQKYSVKTVVTTCPHCFNTLRNEYPQLGLSSNVQVLHYTQFVDSLIKDGKLKPVKAINETVAYHDSCYLGRHNGIYDQPRDIAKAIPGLKLVEMGERCRERGFCCGAGGGHLWIEQSRGTRINHARTEHFLATGAKTVGVSCPYCLQMLEEGVESKGKSGERKVRDVLELLADSVEG
ncbi:MAG: (Fe-S)-binding protein [SAR202 cluster bacterium]|nr:(Fe-S)-binding protein [SAR202 cluster bacterium]